jgi:NAD(P)-dependent dehydrogenase (short-subunit alcohol dehydrogenase family)
MRSAIDMLIANAGHGLGHGFLDQDFLQASRVVDTNVTGTIYLVHKVERDMLLANREDPADWFDRWPHAGLLPGRLQRHQGPS